MIGKLKTHTSGFPINEITEWMKDWPLGAYVVLECEEPKLFAFGYKYSLRSKILTFIGT